ncbi:MAG: PEP-CTERM sorting domain-containing protein, partial [Planctomycetes bacterium]|nr:PEP-CTERM sorting domain-containing protein [Planctomycetota bacterium]
ATYAFRGLRGGSFHYDSILHASDRSSIFPSGEGDTVGFRVSEVPEPATIVMLSLAGVGILRRKRA